MRNVDFSHALATLAPCASGGGTGTRVVLVPPEPMHVALDTGHAPVVDLDVRRAVLDATADGRTCVRGLYAVQKGRPTWSAAIFSDDLTPSTLFHLQELADNQQYDEPLSCEPVASPSH